MIKRSWKPYRFNTKEQPPELGVQRQISDVNPRLVLFFSLEHSFFSLFFEGTKNVG